jgi:hypothetical protein
MKKGVFRCGEPQDTEPRPPPRAAVPASSPHPPPPPLTTRPLRLPPPPPTPLPPLPPPHPSPHPSYMHYLMPKRGILSLHSGCNVGHEGDGAPAQRGGALVRRAAGCMPFAPARVAGPCTSSQTPPLMPPRAQSPSSLGSAVSGAPAARRWEAPLEAGARITPKGPATHNRTLPQSDPNPIRPRAPPAPRPPRHRQDHAVDGAAPAADWRRRALLGRRRRVQHRGGVLRGEGGRGARGAGAQGGGWRRACPVWPALCMRRPQNPMHPSPAQKCIGLQANSEPEIFKAIR